MGLLDQLWDDTVAGPQPEHGLGKLRKHPTFTSRKNTGKEADGGIGKSYGEELASEAVKVTRRIMIIKPPTVAAAESPPASPAASTPPVSPFSGSVGSRGESNRRFRRRSTSDVHERRGNVGLRSPTTSHDV